MRILNLFKIFLSLINIFINHVSCELVSTMAIIGGISGIGAYYYQYVHCKYNECCNDEYINLDLRKLEKIMKSKLFGQHIAYKTIMNALHGYLNEHDQGKALAFSFHGPPGTGKNFVAKFITEAMFQKGTDSKYFHFFNGRTDFPLKGEVEKYKIQLQTKIKAALEECSQSLFVFDEVDKMPEGILNVLVPFLDYNTWSTKGGTNKAIFIFLSNTGSRQIVQQLLSLWESGVSRDNTKLQDFENLISIGAFNEKGGFHLSDTIETSVIDHYIPFLPLEEEHVKNCVKKAFVRKNVEPTAELIKEALSHMTFDPPPHNLYSKSGCKRIEQKVATIVYSGI